MPNNLMGSVWGPDRTTMVSPSVISMTSASGDAGPSGAVAQPTSVADAIRAALMRAERRNETHRRGGWARATGGGEQETTGFLGARRHGSRGKRASQAVGHQAAIGSS